MLRKLAIIGLRACKGDRYVIQSTNTLNDHQLLEAKALIATCHDGTFRDPYLSNMLNFDPNMPAFFSFIMKKRWTCWPINRLCGFQDVDVAIPFGLITVGRELRCALYRSLPEKKRHLIQLSLWLFQTERIFLENHPDFAQQLETGWGWRDRNLTRTRSNRLCIRFPFGCR